MGLRSWLSHKREQTKDIKQDYQRIRTAERREDAEDARFNKELRIKSIRLQGQTRREATEKRALQRAREKGERQAKPMGEKIGEGIKGLGSKLQKMESKKTKHRYVPRSYAPRYVYRRSYAPRYAPRRAVYQQPQRQAGIFGGYSPFGEPTTTPGGRTPKRQAPVDPFGMLGEKRKKQFNPFA